MMIYKILLLIIFFFLFTSLWGFYSSIRPPKIISTITPKDMGLNYEEVSFTTADGIKLAGWFIPLEVRAKGTADATGVLPLTGFIPSSAKTIILLHGYPADKGNILPAFSFLNKNYNLLLFDFRYLGQSEGNYTTAGAKEVEDLLAAIRFLKTKDINQVGVWGFSMGGAVALMTAPIAPEIKAIVAESSYASLDLMALELYRIPILKYPIAYLTGFWAKIFLGIDLKKVSPAESAKNITIPVLIVHSKNDIVIPFRSALLIQEALKNNMRTEFWLEENIPHGQFSEIYEEKIGEFFGKNL